MLRHPFFADLLLHSDDELSELLAGAVLQRATVHEWPLSCVQKVVLGDGRALAYKSQLPPTVEPLFYQRASSPLLAGHRLLEPLGRCQTMVIEWIDAPSLHTEIDAGPDLLARGRDIVVAIGEIGGQLPFYLDVGSAERWTTEVEVALEKVANLIQDRRFHSLKADVVERVRDWAGDPQVIETVTRDARIVNADLRADQILVTADGYRVLDWQRPIIAAPELDLVSLLLSEGIDPRRYLDADAVRYWLLRLHWAAEAQYDLFPNFHGPLFDQWAREAVDWIVTDGRR